MLRGNSNQSPFVEVTVATEGFGSSAAWRARKDHICMTVVTTRSPEVSGTSAFSRSSTAWDNRLKAFVYILAAGCIAVALWFASFEAATLLLHPRIDASRYFGVHILRFTRESRRISGGRRVETAGTDWRPIPDRHVAEKAVTMSVLSLPHNPLTNRKRTAKLALLFLTDQGLLPLKRVWDRFFQAELKGSVEREGDNSKFSVYVHSGGTGMRYNADEGRFLKRNDIPSLPAQEGSITTVDAQRRLLAWALLDRDNHFFLFLHHTAIPIQSFSRIYSSLLHSRHSFVAIRLVSPAASQKDEGRTLWAREWRAGTLPRLAYTSAAHNSLPSPFVPRALHPPFPLRVQPASPYHPARADDPTAYPRGLAPLVPQHKFARSSKWVAVNRAHATAIVADCMFYRAFKLHCPGWREMLERVGEWEEAEYGAVNITSRFIQDMQEATTYLHKTPDSVISPTTCRWNGQPKPCFMFARPFRPDSADEIMSILPNVLHY
ncbi:unnamed protein product [Closterium sp. Yama58-4]|nr:unnamed protein product [Closterium sp. Yama58-4]